MLPSPRTAARLDRRRCNSESVSDLVVTVPKGFWFQWIEEGDAAGAPATGEEWGYSVGTRPNIEPGERLYVVAWGLLRGYAPVTRVFQAVDRRWVICREGGAVAVTIPEQVKGFRGARKRWWDRSQEKPFPAWQTAGTPR